jgi:hypothetical protein
MSAQAAAELPAVKLERRARSVWVILTVMALAFIFACSSLTYWLSTTLGGITTPQTATLEARTGAQLIVSRNHVLAPELITRETTLREGDAVQTSSSGGAFLQLFDGSTIQTYFDTKIHIERLRIGELFQNTKEASVVVDTGTVVVVTADLGLYSSAKYMIATETSVIEPDVKSKLRLRVEGPEGARTTSAFIDYGSARLLSHGRQLQLTPGTMARISADGTITGPSAIEEELVQNGNFTEEPTSGAELLENGGLGTAGWLPIRTQASEPVSEPGVTDIVTETLGTSRDVKAVRFRREGSSDKFAQLGIQQEVNRPVEFLTEIELLASIKIVDQSATVGGPQENVFPLTIRVTYSDSEQKQHEWKHSFYYSGPETAPANTSRVLQGTWKRHKFVLKSSQAASDMTVINEVEVYGYGRQFQSWVTDISILAR